MNDDLLTFEISEHWVGHGAPGVDLQWHRRDVLCAECDRLRSEARASSLRITAVDPATGTITIGSKEEP